MKIYDFPSYNKNGNMSLRVEPNSKWFVNNLRQMDSLNNEEAVKILNRIGNQGIEKLDAGNLSYVVNGVTLPLVNLCSAERIFLAAYMADVLKSPLCITADIKELDWNTTRLFFEVFGKSEFVDVMLPYEDNWATEWLRDRLEEI